jgi:mediator of RNA polymerase II transcription subunit 5
MACRSGQLTVSTFKSGLELLLEPFLLPSLVVGLGWLASYSWEDHGDADILLQMLDKLLRPSSSASETQVMHRAVLAIVAEPLISSLQELVRKRPEKTVANAMVALLRRSSGSNRSLSSNRKELDGIATASRLANYVGGTVRDLTAWASNVTPTPPPRYSHKLLTGAYTLLDRRKATRAMTQELQKATYPAASIALDVCTSLLCAADVPSQTLRQHLLLQSADTEWLLSISAGEARAILQISRSVEAQMAVHQIEMPVSMAMQPLVADHQIMQELGLADPNALGDNQAPMNHDLAGAELTEADLNAVMDQPMDLRTPGQPELPNVHDGDVAVDQSQDFFTDMSGELGNAQSTSLSMQAGEASGGQQNQEEDIFAGLDMSGGMGDLGDDFVF